MPKFKFSLTFNSLWLWLMLFISASALVYFLYSLNIIGLIASFIIASMLHQVWQKEVKTKAKIKSKNENTKYFWIYSIITIILLAILLALSINARTEQAIISPWTVINPWFWIILSGANLTLIIALTKTANSRYKNILLGLYYFVIFSITAIVYRISYGFDPFIHQAAMAEINRIGFILPKTPYYLGEYGVIIALYKLSGLSLSLINQYFLPLISALSLPCLLSHLRQESSRAASWLAIILLNLIGFSPFIINTPQNFSYLLLLAVIIFVYRQEKITLTLSTAVATFAVHPLAGIPALFITAWSIIQQRWPKIKISCWLRQTSIIFTGALLIFCLSIWAISGFSSLSFQIFNLSQLNPILANSENYWLNFSYFFINNYFWLILVAALTMIFKRKQIWPELKMNEKINLIFFSSASLAALTAYIISLGFKFNNLIAYEQGDYAARLPIIAFIIALPLFYRLFKYFSQQALRTDKTTKIISAAGLALILSITVYASYPRFDHYHNSRGYSTGIDDIKAVKRAEEKAAGTQYITLANQQVSAAALHEFGFNGRYINKEGQEIYFYPIPTGGPLYQYYLDMVYKNADRQTMIKAMDFAGVNRAYLIINKYWWASDKIIAEAKMSADYWEKIGTGEDYLFEYRK